MQALGLDEAPYADLPTAGWSAVYVERETRRAVEGLGDGIPVYPGIDVDILRRVPDDAGAGAGGGRRRLPRGRGG